MSTSGALVGGGLGRGFQFWGLIGLIALAVLIINSIWAGVQNNRDRQAAAHVAAIQVSSQQITKFASEAAAGNLDAFEELNSTRVEIDRRVKALMDGGNAGLKDADSIPAYKNQGDLGQPLTKLAQTWALMNTAANTIIANKQTVLDISETASDFSAKMPQLTQGMDEIVRVLQERDAPGSQVYFATRQLLLADRMLRRVNEIQQGGPGAVSAADSFGRDANFYGQVLTGLMSGNEIIPRPLTDPQAREILERINTDYSAIGENVDRIQSASTQLNDVTDASDTISEQSEILLTNARDVETKLLELPTSRLLPNDWVSYLAAALALLAAILAAYSYNKGQRVAVVEAADTTKRNQEAIHRLLDEMGSLAEGDLTVKATVTEDFTGAIADSVNFAVEALRSLVTTINATAEQVASSAQETQSTAMQLAEAAEHQAQQITSASAAINEMATSIDEVSKNSAESADVAQRSVQIASKGAEVVRQTIQGMDSIRDQIQETSKRIKRLGESSQEIGSIVELINDIAEQTNILALNAAIQAASAGEAGRGFAVVADEVQRLAERASNATKRIETLVQTIQSDTNEAVSSMEQTTAEVVAGARLAEDAGLALGEIEKVSGDLADLIQNISEASRQQSSAATNISATMNVIQEITAQTSAGASQTADSIGNLAQLASNLRKSVADFKLPT